MTAFFKNIPKVPILYQVIPICVQLCSVEHKLNTSLTFLLSKLDSPVIKTLDRIRFTSNQNIGEGGSNFDEKNVEEVFNFCSTKLLVTKLVL